MLPPDAAPTPADTVHYRADHVLRHSRLTTFFRWLLVLPHYVVLFVYGIAAGIAVVIAWFAIVLTAHYPRGLYGFVAGLERYLARVNGYAYLLTDVYPPFSGGEHPEYPVRLEIGPPKERYSRLLTFFRIFLLIPVYLIAYVLGILLGIVSFVAWFVIVIAGRLPAGLHVPIAFSSSYVARASVYAMLLTERFPSFDGRPPEPVAATTVPGDPVV